MLKSCLIFALSLATFGHADVNAAKAFYIEGSALEKAKQYQAAIAKYEEALQAEPRYAYANKQIGNCKYFLGDSAGALQAYDAYLAAVPSDTRTKAFADSLRAKMGGATSTARSSSAGSGPFKAGFGLGVSAGFNTYSMKDFNALFTTTATGTTGGPITSGMQMGLNVGYGINEALRVGLDLDYLMAASTQKTEQTIPFFGTMSSTTDYNFPLMWIGPQASYAFTKLGDSARLRGDLGLGMLMLSGTVDSSSTFFGITTKSSSTVSGSGFGFRLGAGLDWSIAPGFELNVDAGYRIATISTVTFKSATTTGTWTKVDGSPLPLDYSGISSKLGVRYVF